VEESLRSKATSCVKTLIADVFRELRDSAPGPPPPPDLSTENESQQHQAQQDNFGDFNFDFLDAFTMLGDEELRYDQGGLLDNILMPIQEGVQPEEQTGTHKKLSDSGYGSNSPDDSFQTGDDSGTLEEGEQ